MRTRLSPLRLLLTATLGLATSMCNSTAGDDAIPRVCSDAKDCASCLETDGELCIWCAATASCREFGDACEQGGGGNHGFFEVSSRFRIDHDQAAEICELPCSLKGELLVNKNGVTLNRSSCCSSSQPTSGLNGSSCSASNAGESCIGDDDCVSPETCKNHLCVGTPATDHVVCDDGDIFGQKGCHCSIERVVTAPRPVECSPQVERGTVCCAASGWPERDPGASSYCYCRAPLPCVSTSVGCECSGKHADDPLSRVPSCTGPLCCALPDRATCWCDANPLPGETCEDIGGMKVPSCDNNAALGCPEAPEAFHAVSSCYVPDADAGP